MIFSKKFATTIAVIFGSLILIFCVFKTKQYYFNENKLSPINSLIDRKGELEGVNQKRLPKLKIFTNKAFKTEKIKSVMKSFKPAPDSSVDSFNSDHQILTHKYMIKVLSQQQTFLRRCFENHLRTKSETDSKGTILIEFMVLPFGEIRDVDIKKSSFEDKTFQNCVKTVFLRTKVKKFNGEKFLITFPLEFE